jgi:adenosylcobinamide kinase/adenosylcobinamide-phosphate guanylyltransferase
MILITGPARSGKSQFAEHLAQQSQGNVVYVATAQVAPSDRDWQTRIAQHQQRRPFTWQTLEIPIDLSPVLQQAQASDCLLIDSLGTWVANLLDQDDRDWQLRVDQLLESLRQTQAQVIMVAEETGWGVIPAYPLGRQFRDRLGSITRRIGAIANPVYLVVAGQVLNLSQLGQPLSIE